MATACFLPFLFVGLGARGIENNRWLGTHGDWSAESIRTTATKATTANCDCSKNLELVLQEVAKTASKRGGWYEAERAAQLGFISVGGGGARGRTGRRGRPRNVGAAAQTDAAAQHPRRSASVNVGWRYAEAHAENGYGSSRRLTLEAFGFGPHGSCRGYRRVRKASVRPSPAGRSNSGALRRLHIFRPSCSDRG